jgi:hypothetical protein
MDTSKTYIKMNDKLPEDFPDKYILRWGDYYAGEGKPRIYFESGFSLIKDKRIVKLHRQDQLQEMVGASRRFLIFTREWTDFIFADAYIVLPNGEKKVAIDCFHSMEQLWLVFMMKEKYNKVWNGEEWIES